MLFISNILKLSSHLFTCIFLLFKTKFPLNKAIKISIACLSSTKQRLKLLNVFTLPIPKVSRIWFKILTYFWVNTNLRRLSLPVRKAPLPSEKPINQVNQSSDILLKLFPDIYYKL